MTRLPVEHGAIDLSRGFPDRPGQENLKVRDFLTAGFLLRPPEGASTSSATSSFHRRPDASRRLVRFALRKTDDVLAEAARRLERLGR
jgi:hypothetical protein